MPTGEEIYLNTTMPKAQSWATEDQALSDIGKLVGEEFSKNFFLQHFNFGEQKVTLNICGLPDAQSRAPAAARVSRYSPGAGCPVAGRQREIQPAAAGSAGDIIRTPFEAAQCQAGTELFCAGRQQRQQGQRLLPPPVPTPGCGRDSRPSRPQAC
jgi:hypothetical protein